MKNPEGDDNPLHATWLDEHFQALERRLENLLALYLELRQENEDLRVHKEALLRERVQLIEQNDMARARIAEMIDRLRAFEEEP